MSCVALMSKHLNQMMFFLLLWKVRCLRGCHQVFHVSAFMYGDNFALTKHGRHKMARVR